MSSSRELFEVPGPGPYLLSHSVGCLPRAARMRIEQALFAPWSGFGSDGWPDWLAAVDRFREALARLLGGSAAECCPQPSVSAALAALLSGIPREQGREIILASAQSFPSIGFAMKQCERLGYRLVLLPDACDPGDAQVWHEAIDERVAAVVPMHVYSNSGTIAPVADIGRRAREVGAFSIIDACQSAGIVDIDVARWGADAIVGSCVKWLCGGPGAGYLWVRQDLIARIQPLAVGWFSHADPFAFDIHDFRYADDAKRFWGGTPSIAPYVIATEGIATIAALGTAAIRQHNRRLIGIMAEAADLELDMSQRGGTLCLTCDDPDALGARLSATGARFDRRGAVLRLSFHVWNDDREAALIGRSLRGSSAVLA